MVVEWELYCYYPPLLSYIASMFCEVLGVIPWLIVKVGAMRTMILGFWLRDSVHYKVRDHNHIPSLAIGKS